MKKRTFEFGQDRTKVVAEISEAYANHVDEGSFSWLQVFLDQIPDLRPDEPFYFGLWRVMISRIGNRLVVNEWNYEKETFEEGVGRSAFLWSEQQKICESQDVPWTSIASDQIIYTTPNVLSPQQESTVEGVRDANNAPNSSGWFLYTELDRLKNEPFEAEPLTAFLRSSNFNVLRFLCIPDGWSFNIEKSGASHVWEEGLSEVPFH